MAEPMFTFTVEGDVQLARSLSRFADDVKDLRPAFKQIADDFREIERKQFQTEGQYGAGGWQPLSPDYATWKEKNFPGKPILQRTGALMASLTRHTGDSIEDIEKLAMSIGSKLSYAIYHQKDTSRMPARPVIKLTEDDKKRWMKIFHKFLVASAKKEGLHTT